MMEKNSLSQFDRLLCFLKENYYLDFICIDLLTGIT